MASMYEQIKKQNGEGFARTLRDHHSGLLEIPGLRNIVRHAGRDAVPLLPYLMTLLSANDDRPEAAPDDPFALLAQAGYDAFYADTLEKQNSIKRYFAPGELLCTFNDASRYRDYHIVHAVKTDAAALRREDFKGREERQDHYGTSVISIQVLKKGGFIKITNRYNHAVAGADNTFSSNPDKIIPGLSAALKTHFNVDFSASHSPLPDGFVLMCKNIFEYHREYNNTYYGDQAWAKNGVIHAVNRGAGDALFDGFLFNNKTKTLQKIDPEIFDSFADDLNRYYGGKRALHVRHGNLMLGDTVLIGAERSQIKTVYLPALIATGNGFLFFAPALTSVNLPSVRTMGYKCLCNVPALKSANFPSLTVMGSECLKYAGALTSANLPSLTKMGHGCLYGCGLLTSLNLFSVTTMDDACLYHACNLKSLSAPLLTTMGHHCLYNVSALTSANLSSLTKMGKFCFDKTPIRESIMEEVARRRMLLSNSNLVPGLKGPLRKLVVYRDLPFCENDRPIKTVSYTIQACAGMTHEREFLRSSQAPPELRESTHSGL